MVEEPNIVVPAPLESTNPVTNIRTVDAVNATISIEIKKSMGMTHPIAKWIMKLPRRQQ